MVKAAAIIPTAAMPEVQTLSTPPKKTTTTHDQTRHAPPEIRHSPPNCAVSWASAVSDALRAVSAGEGTYTAVLSHYQPVPDAQVAHVIANAGSDS
eukprot:3506770-Rhodomonas_salina.1